MAKPDPVEIVGKVKCADGKEIEFSITKVGWQQWGEVKEVLGRTVYLMDALTEASETHLIHPDDDDDEEKG